MRCTDGFQTLHLSYSVHDLNVKNIGDKSGTILFRSASVCVIREPVELAHGGPDGYAGMSRTTTLPGCGHRDRYA
jgi:hypothetical protein